MKPMLAATCDSVSGLSYPVLASPKYDGVRALVLNGQLVSRNLKPIRNNYTRERFSHIMLDGLDGELTLGPHDATVFRRTGSATSRYDGNPEVTFNVFDVHGMSAGYGVRYDYLTNLKLHNVATGIRIVEHTIIRNSNQLVDYEERCLNDGYEGVMVRSLTGPYKEGRATAREGYLLKVKRFADAEAIVIGFEERMHNGNEATTNALGHTERSSHQANMTGRGDFGALIVRGINGPYKDAEFRIGTGFDDADREYIWERQNTHLGQICKYKHFPMGSKLLPRFPVFLGWRPSGT